MSTTARSATPLREVRNPIPQAAASGLGGFRRVVLVAMVEGHSLGGSLVEGN